MVPRRFQGLTSSYCRRWLDAAACDVAAFEMNVILAVSKYHLRCPKNTRCHASSLSSLPQQVVTRKVKAFFLRPDADEVSLLSQLRTTGNDEPVKIAWGEKLPVAEIVDVLIARYPSAEELDALAPGLQSVVAPFAGPTATTLQLLRERPHLSFHNCHFNAASTAELAIALILAATKQLLQKDQRLRLEARASISTKQPWTAGWQDQLFFNSKTLTNRKALVLGLGAIGTRVASVLSALGLEVHAIRRQVLPVRGGTRSMSRAEIQTHSMEELHSLLLVSEIVVICLPGTSATDGLLGSRELGCMPRGSVLVNVGRGSVVDEDALFESLRDGHLGAAGLDVWFNYPMLPGQGLGRELPLHGPSRHPFHELPNVVMTPHVGQCSTSKAEDCILELKSMLQTMSETGALPNRFDIDAGY